MKKPVTVLWRGRVICALPLLLAILACGLDLQPNPKPKVTPTPLVRLGPESLQVLRAVPWGTLRLDGQSAATLGISLAPRIPDETAPAFTLRAGQHTLEYTADPFPPLRCQISQPASASDTCPLFDPPPKYPVQNQNGSRIVDVGATLDHLSANQLATLQQVAQAQLTALSGSSATLAQGERYLSLGGTVAVAAQAWNATPEFALNSNPNDDGPWAGQPCAILCETYPGAALDTSVWNIVAHIFVTWSYLQTDGIYGMHWPAAQPERHENVRQPLAVRWNGSWQVSVLAASARIPTPLCAVAMSLLGDQLTPTTAAPELANYAWYGIGARTPADGCLLLGGPSTASGPPTGATANVLYRFGLLYAANDTAHRLLPSLPLVDAHGQAVAAQIAAQPR
jgi:hypothetical protein